MPQTVLKGSLYNVLPHLLTITILIDRKRCIYCLTFTIFLYIMLIREAMSNLRIIGSHLDDEPTPIHLEHTILIHLHQSVVHARIHEAHLLEPFQDGPDAVLAGQAFHEIEEVYINDPVEYDHLGFLLVEDELVVPAKQPESSKEDREIVLPVELANAVRFLHADIGIGNHIQGSIHTQVFGEDGVVGIGSNAVEVVVLCNCLGEGEEDEFVVVELVGEEDHVGGFDVLADEEEQFGRDGALLLVLFGPFQRDQQLVPHHGVDVDELVEETQDGQDVVLVLLDARVLLQHQLARACFGGSG